MQLILGDCIEYMKTVPDNTFDLTVTSPPYDNLRTYDGTLNWNEEVWKEILKELYRVTKVGGVVVWIVGDATIKGSETGTSFKQALWAKECGFSLHDTMIWNKKGFTSVGSLISRYAQVFEYMFVFTKGHIRTFSPIKDRKNIHAGTNQHGTVVQKNGLTKRVSGHNEKKIAEYGQRFNIWEINPCKEKDVKHPARFPIQLAIDHIKSWSNEADIVFDPFMGSGTTGVAALKLGRDFVGCEIVPKYYEIAKERIGAVQCTINT